MGRIGWDIVSATEVRDHTGLLLDLTAVAPADIRARALQGVQAWLFREFAERNGWPWLAEGPMLQPLLRVLKGSALTMLQKAALRKTVTGGIWTAEEQQQRGYEVDCLCRVCGVAPDSRFHRLFGCQPCFAGSQEHVQNRMRKRMCPETPQCRGQNVSTAALPTHPPPCLALARDFSESYIGRCKAGSFSERAS